MMIDHQPKPERGSFPKGPFGETTAQRRQRYEEWVLGTSGQLPDIEAQSIAFYRGRTKMVPARPGSTERKEVPAAPSRKLCAASRCRQCEACDDDPNGHLRIANCRVPKCGLWPVRPYQEFASTPAPLPTGRVDYAGPIRQHCLDCVGGSYLEVKRCTTVTCALFPARLGATETGGQAEASASAPEAGDA